MTRPFPNTEDRKYALVRRLYLVWQLTNVIRNVQMLKTHGLSHVGAQCPCMYLHCDH